MSSILESIHEFDEQLLLAINSWHSPWADDFMFRFSGKWIWVVLYLATAYALVRMYGIRRGLVCVLAVSLTVVFADQVCASVIRPVAERLRPANVDNPLSPMVHIVESYRGGSYGFPSCHAANTFGVALITSLLLRRRWYTLFIYVWAAMTCYSRMYLGVHYPGDIVVGAAVGSLGALVIWFVLRYVARRWGNAKKPPVVRLGGLYVADIPILVGLATVLVIAVVATCGVFGG